MTGELLEHVLGSLSPQGSQNLSSLYEFSQASYGDVWAAGLSNKGFVYVPNACMEIECKVHVLFHGCFGSFEINGFTFMTEIGVNDYAESNEFIVIYPQITAHSNNPEGCWDFWGYTGDDFMIQSALQISIVHKMAQNPPIVNWNN